MARGKIIAILLYFCIFFESIAQVHVDTLSADRLVREILLTESVFVTNIRYSGSALALGYFRDTTSMLNFNEGILLGTGNIFFVPGPNSSQYTSWINQRYGDEQLQALAHGRTYDAAILEFDFIPSHETVYFEYVFASEEYNEYVGSKFNDVFGFWIHKNGTGSPVNIGTVGENKEPVTVNTVNLEKNQDYFVNNDYVNTTDPILWDTRKRKVIPNKDYGKPPIPSPYNLSFDGFTKVLTATYDVEPGHSYHIRMSISDVSDAIYDSWVILRAHSFGSKGTRTFDLKPLMTAVTLEKVEPLSLSFPKGRLRDPSFVEKGSVWKAIGYGESVFPFDISLLSQESLQSLRMTVESINQTIPFLVYLQGHTDSDGSNQYNINLSKKRVESVATALQKLGIRPEQIIYEYFGEEMPIDSNETEKGRARNRRVELYIYYLN